MSTKGSTAKVSDISSVKKPTRSTNQHILTFDIPPSKGKQELPTKSSDSVAIDIDRQSQATCPICIGDYPSEELKSSLKCQHAFCSACLTEYLTVKINNNEVLEIPCPQSGCTEIFTEKSVKKIIPSKEYTKYQDRVTRKMMLRGPKQNYCPQPGCSRPVKLVEGQDFTMCKCGAKICNACHNLFHEGKSCIEAIDSDFEKYTKENGVKFCMMCKTIVVKETGCNTIKCAVCDYKWCWVCGREYHMSDTCPGEWDPIPPASVRQDDFMGRLRKSWREGSTLKRIGICLSLFLLSPFLLVGFIIVAPTYYVLQSRVELVRRKPFRSMCVIIGVILFGLLYLPETLTALLLLALFCVFVLPFVYLVKYCRKKFGKEAPKPQLNTRWHSRNAENFVYRPTNPHG